MSAFTVGMDMDGHVMWWENWTLPGHRARDMRPATSEEEELMERIVWQTATVADIRKLRSLLGGK